MNSATILPVIAILVSVGMMFYSSRKKSELKPIPIKRSPLRRIEVDVRHLVKSSDLRKLDNDYHNNRY